MTRATLRAVVAAAVGVALFLPAAHLAAHWRQRIERANERANERALIEQCVANVRLLLWRMDYVAENSGPVAHPVAYGSTMLFDMDIVALFPDDYWKGLRCPADPGRELAPDIAHFSDGDRVPGFFSGPVHLDAAGMRRIGVYAARDFMRFPFWNEDLPHTAKDEQWLICDRCGDDGRTLHHPGGLVVGFVDGTARFVTLEELGLSGPEGVVIGPESRHPEMRTMATVMTPKK